MRFSTGWRQTSSSLAVVAALLGCGGCQDTDGAREDAGGDGETQGELEGDEVRGGALYDRWWAVTRRDEPVEEHPLWASRPDTQSTATGADTWRCKECHGWDYAGVDGAYGSGSHRTGFAGILGTEKSNSAIIELLADPAGHAYGEVLDEQSLADLAAFVRDGTMDTTSIIASDGAFTGDVRIGQTIFERACLQCHGSDGLRTPPGADEQFASFPGLIANDNPQEFLHKVRFGQPGSVMPAQANQLSNDALAALGAYAQTLPQMR
jgi:cytochrome c553